MPGDGAPDGADKTPPDGGDKTPPDGGDDQGNARHRRAEARNKELADELKSTKQKLKEFEDGQKEAAEAAARDQGKWEELLANRDKTIAERDATIAELTGEVQRGNERDLERSILDSLGDQVGQGMKRSTLKGHYLAMLEEQGLPRFPKAEEGKSLDRKKLVADRLKGLTEFAPDLFTPQEGGGSPPSQKKSDAAGGSKLTL